MGRLFWKIFLGFWLALVLIAAGVGLAVYLNNQARLASLDDLAEGPRAAFAVGAVADALAHGGRAAVEMLFEQWPGRRRPPVLLVDGEGRELFGRPVPAGALDQAREAAAGQRPGRAVRRVAAPDGREFLLFIPVEGNRMHHLRHGPPPEPAVDPFYVRLAVALLASLLFSAGLAWYLTGPVRHMRRAARRLAEGDLDARVMPAMGGRRDEIADLGRDFDHMAERLQALVGAQRRLLHDVSHELRSPLARLQVAVALARQQPERLEAMLGRIERESGRLDELVGQVLTLSRLEAGVRPGRVEEVDLAALLEEVVQDARFEAEAAGRRVSLNLAAHPALEGSVELLRRALENVIRNAVHHTAPGTAVEVALRERAGQVVVEVCDRGPGVPEGRLEGMFEPFVRAAEQEATGAREGYGLGLAIAKRAVQAHGGEISAANRPNGGLCVSVTLQAGGACPAPGSGGD